MKNPKISVIMPVYNGMPFLKEAVQSVLSQTFTNFEFIIVDDNSNDQSPIYLKSLKDRRIILLTNTTNIGIANSLNKAIKKASGDYIARMDADDISLPKRLELEYAFLKNNQAISLCGGWSYRIDKNGKTIDSLKYSTNPYDIKKVLIYFNPIIHPTFFCEKAFFKNNLYNSDFEGAEDYELLLRGIDKFNYANLPEFILKLRITKKSRSQKEMKIVDLADLRVKLSYLRRNPTKLTGYFAVVKKMIMTYLIPKNVKTKLVEVKYKL